MYGLAGYKHTPGLLGYKFPKEVSRSSFQMPKGRAGPSTSRTKAGLGAKGSKQRWKDKKYAEAE